MRTMKAILLLFFTCFAMLSCTNAPLEGNFNDEIGTGDSTGGGSGGGASTESFFAKVDGVEFVETMVTKMDFSGSLTISGSTSSSSALAITVPNTITPGSYSIDLTTYKGQYNNADVSPTVSTVADSGTITISAHDTTAKTIVGTFSFVSSPLMGTTPQYTITDGSFSVSY